MPRTFKDHRGALRDSHSSLLSDACADFGIQLVGTGTVESCKVDACTEDGIEVETNDPAGSTVTVISKNTVTRCSNGILADDGPFTVDKNTCEQNSGEGIAVNITLPEGKLPETGTTITKNKANNNLETGIIGAQPETVDPLVLFEKNTMDGNGSGCVLEGFSIDAKSNTIQNSVEDGLVVEASDCNLEKNEVKGNGRRGIEVEGDNNTLFDNTVIGNEVTDNEHDGIDNSGLNTIIGDNNSKNNGGADIAGAGQGGGTVSAAESIDNVMSDESDIVGFTTLGELDLD